MYKGVGSVSALFLFSKKLRFWAKNRSKSGENRQNPSESAHIRFEYFHVKP